MSYVKTKGIVIKETDVNDFDKIVTIFTLSEGRVEANAKGARRNTCRISAGTQLLNYSEFNLFKGKKNFSINSCEVIESFYPIRQDVVKLTYVSHMIDLLMDFVQPNDPQEEILKLFLYALNYISKGERKFSLINGIFELKLLSLSGYSPNFSACSVCATKKMDNIYYSINKCGILCEECAKSNNSYEIGVGIFRALCYVIFSDIKSVFKFELSDDILPEFNRVITGHLRQITEKTYNKLEFLNKL